MAFTKRFIYFFILGLLIMVVLIPLHISTYIFLFNNMILFSIYAFDIFLTPGKSDIYVERFMEEKFSIGSKNLIKLKIGNKSKHPASIFIKDESIKNFEVSSSKFLIYLKPFEVKEIKYYLIPSERGEFNFKYVYIKARGNLNFCKKYFRYKLVDTFKVYPNIKNLSKIDITTIKKASLNDKMKKSKIYGDGNEFESLRDYLLGDSYKDINWSASARLNKLIVNNYEPEKNQQVYILIDSSRVMNTKINNIKKLDHAINSAVLLSKYVIENGDNVGIVIFDSKVKTFIKAQKGKQHFFNILNKLYNVDEKLVSADYFNVFNYINKRENRKGIMFVFTEHFNVEEAKMMTDGMKFFMKKYIPFVISVRDIKVDKMIKNYVVKENEIFLKSAAVKINREREKSKKVMENMGIRCLDIAPDKLSIELINGYLQIKSKIK